ncbi:hypothetical protein ABEF92_003730 [Exophiala dermatitidis]|uniref:Uncharacterized protein n=1 Tax=Exophiala dermatitidis (strain ATCC 34100 / CBS 525.76 / NIH/UT8656) TaxID=858893 RepID=H6BUT5_EXODN|nr:uncharacterized protein HMPREF1120_03896 [Exophiala dermatitidis NIH/UT8656]EHY55772.1 hypothetical protein HMPREF1120_03896 [Exophiala dermatitidis NIH/UT8656]
MGLPMFREPEEAAAEEAALKLDQIAATRRSTIRRESSVRPGRITSSRSLLDRIRETRREATNEQRNTSSLQPSARSQRDSERDIYDLDADLGRLRSLRMRQRARANQLERDINRRSDRVRLADPMFRHDASLDLSPPVDPSLESALGPSFPSPDELIAQHLPRPSRESGLRFEVAASSQSETETSRQPRLYSGRTTRVPSPSALRRIRSTLMHASRAASLDNDLDDYGVAAATLTPGFAPAQGAAHSSAENLGDDRARRAEYGTLDGFMDLDVSPADGHDALYPPLRRVNHASPRPVIGAGSRIDGLGDRMRSPSPASDNPEEENWTTLLTTMDPGRSTAAASFMSSNSDSRSGSNRSSQATSAATSFGEIAADDSCDLDLPSGITEADVREIRARHGRLRREPPSRSDESVHDAINNRNVSRGGGNDRILELEVFSVILDRMQRREDIPEEWWAAVGLSPDVVRGSA